MHVRAGRTLGAVAVAVALALAGCGSGGRVSKGEYEQKLRSAGDELSAAVQQLAKARSKEQFKDDVTDVERALDDAADELDGSTPPQDVEAANDRLVDGFRRLADDFDQVKDAADESVDAATSKAQQITGGAASREAQQAVEEIKRRGYDVGKLRP
jgi:cob(I)alamin adenosyltransferase